MKLRGLPCPHRRCSWLPQRLRSTLNCLFDDERDPGGGEKWFAGEMDGAWRRYGLWLRMAISLSSVVTRTWNWYLSTSLSDRFDLIYILPIFGAVWKNVAFFEIDYRNCQYKFASFWLQEQPVLEIIIRDYPRTRFNATNPIRVSESWNELSLEITFF